MPANRILDFILQRPDSHGKRSFAIIRRQGTTNRTLKLPDLDIINERYKKGTIDFETASKLAEDIRARLYKEQKYNKNFHPDNKKFLDEYWKRKFEKKDITDKRAAFDRLKRAIDAIGELSLLTASQDELQDKIYKHPQQRRIAPALNEMLKFFGRNGVEIPLNKKKRKKPKYFTAQELKRVIAHIECEDPKHMATLMKAAFGTGMRLGEVYGIEPYHLRNKNKVVYVEQQLRPDGETDTTKTSSSRLVPILPAFEKDVVEWVMKVPEEKKLESRIWRHAEIVKNAAIKVFPNNPDKHCVFHDLRHSYAITMLQLGFSMTTVAQCLGNSWQVCQEYYAGFDLTNENVAAIVTQLNRKKA